MQQTIDNHRDQLQEYEALCEKMGEEPANVALAWLLSNPIVTAPIIGPRTLEQLEGSPHAIEIHLSDEENALLNRIWPSPGGESPEAYAW